MTPPTPPPGPAPPGHFWDYDWSPPNAGVAGAANWKPNWILKPKSSGGGLLDTISGGLNTAIGGTLGKINANTLQQVPQEWWPYIAAAALGYGGGQAIGALGAGGSAYNPAYAGSGAGSAGGAAGSLGAVAPAAGSLPSSAGTAATFDPFDAAAGGTGWGTAGAAGTPGAAASAGGFDWKPALMKLASTGGLDALFGGPTSQETELSKLAGAGYDDPRVQAFLPAALRSGATDPVIAQGLAQIARLLANPGSLSPTVSTAVMPRLAEESANIAQNYRGIASDQAGALARSNAPTSLKGALASALDVAQERAQRGARNEALTASDELRRRDIAQVYDLLSTILQYTGTGRGQSLQGLTAASREAATRRAAEEALFASVLSGLGLGGK